MNARYYPHSFGGGLVLGLLAAERAWLVFAAGVAVGVLLVLALRIVRGAGRLAVRLGRMVSGPVLPATPGPLAASRWQLTPDSLSDEERARERAVGLRQGEAAGLRAAARAEVRDRAKREAMSEALEDHWREERRRSVRRAVES